MSALAPIRVLWLIKGLGPGGAEQLLVSSAAVRDRGAFEVHCAYLLDRKSDLVSDLTALGVQVHPLHAGPEWDIRWVLRLRRLIGAQQIDVVHTHSPLVAALARLALRTLPRARRPAHVVTEHLPWSGYRPSTRRANSLTFALDDAQIAVSHAVVNSIPRVKSRRIRVIHQGLDRAAARAARSDRATVRRELSVGDDEVMIGTVANYREQKDYPNLFAAARLIVDRGLPVRFVAMGQGPDRAAVEAASVRSGLGDRFVLLGFRDDVARVLAACDVFVLASKNEGLPIALLEALTLGLPVVATAVGGTPEAVTDGIEGFLVPAAHPLALADALEVLVADGALRATMGAAGEKRSESFDIGRAVRETESIYRAVRP